MQIITITHETPNTTFSDMSRVSVTVEAGDGMDGWRDAIKGAAAAAGFHPDSLEDFILTWAEEISGEDEFRFEFT